MSKPHKPRGKRNRERSERAQEMALHYARITECDDDMEFVVSDFIADCCHALGEDVVRRAVERGLTHFDVEKGGRE